MPVPWKQKEEENLGKRSVEISGRLGTERRPLGLAAGD